MGNLKLENSNNNSDYNIGKSVPRVDGIMKATGEVKYLPDIEMQGMLYGKILRSEEPHAIIKEIDITQAAELPGVRAVITGKDISTRKYSFIPNLADKEILCIGKVRFIGDEIAAVAADTNEIAENAIRLIKVKYESLPAVFDSIEAMNSNNVLVHEEKKTNVAAVFTKSFGDIEKGFSESDYIFEDEFETARQAHCCMETRGCIVKYDLSGKVTIWMPTQLQHRSRKQISDATGIPVGNIRVINTPIGGAFGSKVVMDTKVPIAIELSKLTNRPIKFTNTREDEFTSSRARYSFRIKLKTGVNKDGRIIAKKAEVIADNGAYCDEGTAVLSFGCAFFTVLYDAKYTSFESSLVYTNKQPCTAFRGFGNPQMHYAFEAHLDKIAFELGIDPMEIRMINKNKNGNAIASNALITNCTFEQCIQQAAEISDFHNKRISYKEFNKTSPVIKKGIGMAAMLHTGFTTRFFGFNATDTYIKLSENGIISVISPIIELGQGGLTAVTQIVAEGIGADVNNIRIINNDSDIIPYDLGVYGSRHTFLCGNAALDASIKLKEQLLDTASRILNCERKDIDLKNGYVFYKNNPNTQKLSIEEICNYQAFNCGRLFSEVGRYVDELAPEGAKPENYSINIPTYSFGCQVIEVEINEKTGNIKVLKVYAVMDSGRTLNPNLAEGQVEGAIVQGLGLALKEELIINNGRVANPTFTDYKVLHAEDVPEIEVKFIESYCEEGPYGIKGIGESGLVPTAGAIANAVFNASGLLMKELPINSEKVLRAMGKI